MLKDYIRNNSYAIVAAYSNDEIVAALGGIIYHDDFLEIYFPKINPFVTGQKITFHLDNRTGIEELDIDLKVYRVSVKAVVLEKKEKSIYVGLVEYEMKYGNQILDKLITDGYSFPADERKLIHLKEAEITNKIIPDIKEKDNKLGVLVSKAVDRPHTTVMAFLSSEKDDIFIISHNDSFKSKNINRDENCVFAIDHRSSYSFEKAIDWNYTLIKGKFQKVSRSNSMFKKIQTMFIDKNPWEYVFFSDERVDMYYIKPLEILCPEKLEKFD